MEPFKSQGDGKQIPFGAGRGGVGRGGEERSGGEKLGQHKEETPSPPPPPTENRGCSWLCREEQGSLRFAILGVLQRF